MEWYLLLAFATVVLAVLLALGQWIAIALAASGIAVLVIDGQAERLSALGSIAWNSVNNFVLTAIPLFILMGELILRSGVSERFYHGIQAIFDRVPGGLLHTNISASAIFSAISGSSVATGAAIGTVALPAMDRARYDRRLVFSSLAGGGSLGQLIPPSIGALIYASQVQVSVAKLFLAGAVPGILLAIAFSVYLAARVWQHPQMAPKTEVAVRGWAALARLSMAFPLVALMALVLGSIYLGIATPTEAAALGATGAFVIAMIFGKVTPSVLQVALVKTLRLSIMIVFLVIGAQVLSFGLVQTGVTRNLVSTIQGFEVAPIVFYLVLLVLYMLLGLVIEGISIMLLTLPVVFPVVDALGYDPIWFGVVMMLYIELGMITPPVGMNLFVIQGIAPGTSLTAVSRAAIPIHAIMVGMIILLFFIPDIALWLPRQL